MFLDATNCYGISVDNAIGLIFYSGWSGRNSAFIKVATSDGLFRKTLVTSKENPSLQKPRDLAYNNG